MADNNTDVMADAVELELEAMRTDDCSWHPCQVYFSPNCGGLAIKYENNGYEDIITSEEEAITRIRARSLPLQDDDCAHIKPGEHVVVNQNSESETGVFDAEVEKVLRIRHSKRANCRCTFVIKWLHRDLNGGSLTVPSSSLMRLANKNINNDPTISAFIKAVPPSNSCFSSMSPQLNVVNDFDLDLHDLLEKQIEGIRNSVHGSKKRIRDEILGLEDNTNEQIKETDICMPNVKDPEKKLPDNRSPLNPLAARAALASLMSKLPQTEFSRNNSDDNNDFSKITKILLETESAPKPARIVNKSLFSTTSSSEDKNNPEIKTRLTRAKSQKVKVIVDHGKKPSTVTNKRLTRSVLDKEGETKNSSNTKRLTRSAVNHESTNIKAEKMKESNGEEPSGSMERNKKRNTSRVVFATQDPEGNARSNGFKKNSVDLNKHKVRSSPRFLPKT